MEDVKFVIIFDYPSSPEDYIHRIGRTGRSEKIGTAYAFFTPHNMKHANALINVLEEADQVVNPKLVEMARSGHGGPNRSRYSNKNSGGPEVPAFRSGMGRSNGHPRMSRGGGAMGNRENGNGFMNGNSEARNGSRFNGGQRRVNNMKGNF